MQFSILHTSARPEKWREVYRAWVDAAHSQEGFEYILIVDPRWGFTSLPALDRPQDRAFWAADGQINRRPINYVSNVNFAATKARGEAFIVNADDQYPAPDWDAMLRLALMNVVPGNEFVFAPTTGTPDEHTRGIAVMPVISRNRFDRLGYIFYPDYESMYADNDLFEHAKQDGCLFALDSSFGVFPHRHALFTGEEIDDAYAAQNRIEAYAAGNSVLALRREKKFADLGNINITVGVKKVVAVCLPGESFHSRWVSSWTAILCYLMERYTVIPIFTYCSNVFVTRATLLNAVFATVPRPDYILWVDDDNIVTPDQLDILFRDMEANPDLSGVAGWCWLGASMMADQPREYISCGRFDPQTKEDLKYTVADLHASPTHLVPVDYSGFPVFLMRTAHIAPVRNAAVKKNPFIPFTSDSHRFGMSGEDTAFCYFAKLHGARFAVDRRVRVPHLKLNPDEPQPTPVFNDETPSKSKLTLMPAAGAVVANPEANNLQPAAVLAGAGA